MLLKKYVHDQHDCMVMLTDIHLEKPGPRILAVKKLVGLIDVILE